jgi:hypothetical protein
MKPMEKTPAAILAELDEIERSHRTRRLLLAAAPLLVILAVYVVLGRATANLTQELSGTKEELAAQTDELAAKKEEKQKLEDDLQDARLNRDSLSLEIAEKGKQLETLKQSLTKVEELAAKSGNARMAERIERIVARPLYAKSTQRDAPLESAARVRLALSPTKDSYRDRPVYQVRVWVDLPKTRAAEVLKVEYFFDHASFVPKLQTAFDGDAGFALSYRGYGCVDATATLVLADETRHPLPFDMCAQWKAAASTAAGK